MPETNLASTARELIEAFNNGDRDRFRKHVTNDVVYEEIGTQRKFQGADVWIEAWEQWRKAFPDVKGTITNTLTSGNTVVMEITWDGTHNGPLHTPGGTHSPTGKRQVTKSVQLIHFQGDKARECRHYFDMLNLLQQIGVVPQQAKASGR